MEGNAETVSRPEKLDHVETILYEINMLEYCYGRLREQKWADANDYYLCIEGFLLHYRNLIQFFGDHAGLKAGAPTEWSPKVLSEVDVASIQNARLHDDYDSRISRYLCHCNTIRAERDIEWRHIEMYEQILPLVMNFRKLFPSRRRTPREVPTLDAASVSTTSPSSYQWFNEDSTADRLKKIKE